MVSLLPMRFWSWGFALCAGLCAAVPAWAQAYPARPIRMVVPFPAGGSTDVIARALSVKLTELLGQPVIIDNRPGASGNIGSEMVARAAPDGYTILMGTVATQTINPLLFPKMTYDPVRELRPLNIVAISSQVLLVHPTLPARNVRELIALAKARPGELNSASASSGTTGHLGLELFKMMAGINILHVPYKGAGPAMTALISGEVQMLFDSITTCVPQIKAQRVRGIAVTHSKRSSLLPGVPTMSEGGVPGFETTGWWAILVPAAVDAGIASRLQDGVNQALGSTEMRERFTALGVEPYLTSRDELAAFVGREKDRWTKVIKSADIKVD